MLGVKSMQSLEELTPLFLRLALRGAIVLLVIWAFKKLKPADTGVIDFAAEKRRKSTSDPVASKKLS